MLHRALLLLVLTLARELLARATVNFRDWRFRPDGRDGACVAAGGNVGSYDEIWAANENACVTACMASPSCFAYEFAVLKRGYTRCGAALPS